MPESRAVSVRRKLAQRRHSGNPMTCLARIMGGQVRLTPEGVAVNQANMGAATIAMHASAVMTAQVSRMTTPTLFPTRRGIMRRDDRQLS